MALKSYRLRDTLKKKSNKGKPFKKERSIGRILVGGATALIGVALFQQVAGTINKL